LSPFKEQEAEIAHTLSTAPQHVVGVL
jgi:hypothetical protein